MSRATAVSQRRRVHLGPRVRCGICDDILLGEEQYIGLIGNASFTAYETGISEEPGVNHYCDNINCTACKDSPRACIVHADCLRLFMRSCTARDALDRLWLARLWGHRPWRRIAFPTATLRRTTSSPLVCSPSALLHCAERCGLSGLRALPVEILSIIEAFSRPHFFWRCVATVDVATQLSAGPSQPLQSFLLSNVVSWDRGTRPVIAAEGLDTCIPPIIRLTLDRRGLKKLERLPERPPYEQRRFDDSVFVIESQSHFSSTVAHFKNGLLHFALAGMKQNLQLWDTPASPSLRRSVPHLRPYTRFQTINLDQITGITFLLWNGKMLEIHAHSRRTPSADATVNRRHDWYGPVGWYDRSATWIYVPLPRDDPLTHFGCLLSHKRHLEGRLIPHSACFMIRTSLGGETIVGRYEVGGEVRFMLSDTPTNLIYSDGPGRFRPITIVIPYSSAKSESEQIGTLVEPSGIYPRPEQFPGWNWYYSSAPLGNASWIQLFYVEDGVHCRGLLLEYVGGGQRALGQCRLGVDQSKTYTRPSCMAFANVERPQPGTTSKLQATKVSFEDAPEDDRAWSQITMAGTLRFWFTYEETRLEVV